MRREGVTEDSDVVQPQDGARSRPRPGPSQRLRDGGWLDVLLVGVLLVAAGIARRGLLPTDGLWFDDAWVATGAIHGNLSELIMVGSAHPGFTALVMAVDRLGAGLTGLAVPALVAGVVGPAALYLALRRIGYERSISGLLSAALVVNGAHTMYSGRVKGYTLDPLLMFLLAMAVCTLAPRRWDARLGAAWFVFAVVVGSFSGYLLVGSAAAALILVLHPCADRLVRLGALVAQGAFQLAFVVAARRTTDIAGIDRFMEDVHDAHISISGNPVRLLDDLITHLGRIIEVYPGGDGIRLTLLAGAAVSGLVVASLGRRPTGEALTARLFLLILLIAYVGALFGKLPFGPTTESALSETTIGARYTLWLVPGIAVGLGAWLHRLWSHLPGPPTLRRVVDAAVLVSAASIAVWAYEPPLPYPQPGSESATRHIDSIIGPGDVVLITGTKVYGFSVATDAQVELAATPDHQIGFTPTFTDDRLVPLGAWSDRAVSPALVMRLAGGARRTIVYGPPLGPDSATVVGDVLRRAGFTPEYLPFDTELVTIWTPPNED